MIELINPFSPLVFKEHFVFKEHHLIAAKEIMSLAANRGSNHLEVGQAKSSVSNQNLPPHLHPAFEDFFHWQNEVADNIIKQHLMLSKNFDYIVGNSWVNVHGFSGKTQPHSHGLSALSTVAYIKLPYNSGYTEFKDPLYDLKSIHERSDNDLELKQWNEVPVLEGDVLFFPGWLQHQSQENKTNDERWILSSNYINFRLLESMNLGNLLN